MRRVNKNELMSLVLGEKPKPWQVLWDVTYACQLRCSHCYQMNLDWNIKQQLPTQRFLDILDEMRVLGTQELVLSGGDPFIRKDFLDIVDHACQNGFQVAIYSSGSSITEHIATRLKTAGVSWIEVTLMGVDAVTHDEVTRRPGSYKKLLDGIRLLREAGVAVVAKTVLTKTNLGQLDQLVELCRELGVEYKFDPHMWRPWNGTESQIEHLKLNNAELREFYLRYRPVKPQDKTCAMGVTFCNAGHGRIGITPFGKVNPCTTYGEAMVIGDLHTQSLIEIWEQSPALQEYRTRNAAQAHPKCNSCEQNALCDWCPGLSGWAGKPLTEPYEQVCNDTDVKRSVWEEKNGRMWIPLPVINGVPVSAE